VEPLRGRRMGIEKPKESLKLNRNILRFFFRGGGFKNQQTFQGRGIDII